MQASVRASQAKEQAEGTELTNRLRETCRPGGPLSAKGARARRPASLPLAAPVLACTGRALASAHLAAVSSTAKDGLLGRSPYSGSGWGTHLPHPRAALKVACRLVGERQKGVGSG